MLKTIVEHIYQEHNLKSILKQHSKLKNVRYILINKSDVPITYCEFNRFALIDDRSICEYFPPVGTIYAPINPNSMRIVIPSIWTNDHPYRLNTLLLGTDITDLKRNVVELSYDKLDKTIDFVLYANASKKLVPMDEYNDMDCSDEHKLNVHIVIMEKFNGYGIYIT